MPNPDEIVNNALTGETDEPSQYVDWLSQKTEIGRLTGIKFGYFVITSDEETILENAVEAGLIDPKKGPENNEDFWAQMNKDIGWLEANAQQIGREAGLYVQDEGHGPNGDRYASAWILGTLPQEKQIELAKKILAVPEMLSTTSGTIWSFFPTAATQLYRDVSEEGRKVLDVSIEFNDTEPLQEWLRLNLLESEDADDPAQEVDVDAPIPDYFNKLSGEPCAHCGADLTKPKSVNRKYSGSPHGNFSVKGHYDTTPYYLDLGTYRQDEPGNALNSAMSTRIIDLCSRCGNPTNRRYALKESENPDDPETFVRHFVPRLRGTLYVDFNAIKPHFPSVPNYFHRENVDGLILFRYMRASEIRDCLKYMKQNEGSDLFPKTYSYKVPNPTGHVGARQFLEQAGVDAETMKLIEQTNAPIYFHVPYKEFNDYVRLVYPQIKIKEDLDVDDPKGYLDKVTGWIDTFLNAGMTPDEHRDHQFWKKYECDGFNYWVYVHIRSPLWIIVERTDPIYGQNRFRRVFEYRDTKNNIDRMVTDFNVLDRILTRARTSAFDGYPKSDELVTNLYTAHKREQEYWLRHESVDDPEIQHYLDQASPEPCFACGADLTQPASVIRTYINRHEGEADLPLKGHYDPAQGYYATDEPYDQHLQTIQHCDLPEDCDTCAKCGKSTAKQGSVRNESVDEPEADPQTYLNQIHNLDQITYDIQNYGMFVNRVAHWGRWVILDGGAYWATLHGNDDEPPLKADFFREQLAKFMAALGITQFHIKAGQAGPSDEHVWFRLGIPKSQLTPHSWEMFKVNSTSWPNDEPNSTWLPESLAVQESELVSDKMDWSEFFAPLIEYNILSQAAADRYAISQNLESNETLYYLFIEADEASQYANDDDYNACINKILRIIRLTNMRYNSAIKGIMRDMPLDEAEDDVDAEAYIKSQPIPIKACLTGPEGEAPFDASDWFEHATLEDLITLAKGEVHRQDTHFSRSYSADNVAKWSSRLPQNKALAIYLERAVGRWECYINVADAKTWIEHNRPDWYVYLWPDDMLKEGIDDPTPEFINAALNVREIMQRRGYEEGPPHEWTKTYRHRPASLDLMIGVKPRGFGDSNSSTFDITLYRDVDSASKEMEPIAYHYNRNGATLERTLIRLEQRAANNDLSGIRELPEALDPDDPEMNLVAHTQDLVPDPDKPVKIHRHQHGEAEAELQALGFQTSWTAGRSVVFGEPYVPNFWSKHYPGSGVFVKINVGDLSHSPVFLSIRTRRMSVPIRLQIRSLAHVVAIVKDVDAAMTALPTPHTKKQEIDAVLNVLDHHRQWCIGEAQEDLDDPERFVKHMETDWRKLAEKYGFKPVADKLMQTTVLGQTVQLTPEWFDLDEYIFYHWPGAIPRDCTELVNDHDCLSREGPHCASCAEFERLTDEFANHERNEALPEFIHFKIDYFGWLGHNFDIRLFGHTLDQFLRRFFKEVDKFSDKEKADAPRSLQRAATHAQHSITEAVDEPVADPDDPADVLKSYGRSLVDAELKRLQFEAVFTQGVIYLYGGPILDYWTKQYRAPDGQQHALYLYFLRSHAPMIRANNWNYVAKAWYQRGKEMPTDAVANSEAHFCAIIRDLDAAMQRSTADSLPPDQEHEMVEAVLKHHREWYDKTLADWGSHGIQGRIGPGQPA